MDRQKQDTNSHGYYSPGRMPYRSNSTAQSPSGHDTNCSTFVLLHGSMAVRQLKGHWDHVWLTYLPLTVVNSVNKSQAVTWFMGQLYYPLGICIYYTRPQNKTQFPDLRRGAFKSRHLDIPETTYNTRGLKQPLLLRAGLHFPETGPFTPYGLHSTWGPSE